MNDISLADFVIESGQRARDPIKEGMRAIGRELILNRKHTTSAVKRYVYNDDIRQRWRALEQLPIQEFIAQFDRIRLPFDKLWIEETPDPETVGKPGQLQRKGFLITKKEAEIRTRYASEFLAPDLSNPLARQGFSIIQRFGHVRNNHYMLADNIEEILSSKGVSLDTSKGIHTLNVALGIKAPALKERAYGSEGNQVRAAESILRLLVLVSSRNVVSNLTAPNTTRETSAHPAGNLEPIVIDLSAPLEKAIAAKDVKVIRDLLGWTDVSRHTRTYHTRNGPIVKEIEPFERRIAAPVDRSGVTRVLKAIDPNATLALPDRPKEIPSTKKEDGLNC